MEQTLEKALRIYFIMGSQNCKQDPVSLLKEAAKAGITAFQFREKGKGALTGSPKLELGKKLREVCWEHQLLFIVNDDVELVDKLEADGLHVGQDDRSVQEVRDEFPEKIIGLSVSNSHEVDESPIELVDYLGAGPIFGTTTKPDAKKPVGIEWIQDLREQFPTIPLVGIGGIHVDNAASVMEAGANGVAVISAITDSVNVTHTVRQL
ncbi:thiamine phosphate synthase [Ornithinibacillus xuwenensis]|uniref:Thiamine-phosphate synthase n=1 Tax=Ornithinibacillus xuwenensis TaxID=3144668 RepID=A0ABU9XIV7_9BACI